MMTIADLIEELQKCNQNQEVIIFDDVSIPYRVTYVVIDPMRDGKMSHIVIEPMEQ